ncbi:MAG TPA: hypothetical protein VGJ94_07020 [Syntrophorhabdaceae bacterium]
MLKELSRVIDKLGWMREHHIWPNGLRYLWTDAFGVALLTSLYKETGEAHYLHEAEWVVKEVYRVLGRPKGIRIGEEPDRDGQYYHYLIMWIFALGELGKVKPEYREIAVDLAWEIHHAFVIPEKGVIWKMKEDLSGPYPGSGLGGIDHFDGYVVYRLLDPHGLAQEIKEMEKLVEKTYRDLVVTQDLGLGMMLWTTHFFPEEPWALLQKERCLETLETMWVDPPGYFCREPYLRHMKFAFTNYGVSLGLQSVGKMADKVDKLNNFFETYHSGDEYDTNAITHVMSCNSRFPGCLISDGL